MKQSQLSGAMKTVSENSIAHSMFLNDIILLIYLWIFTYNIIFQMDNRLVEMTVEITERKRRLDRLCEALERVELMNNELMKMNVSFIIVFIDFFVRYLERGGLIPLYFKDSFGALTASLEDLTLLLPSDIILPPLRITPPLPPPSIDSSPSTSSPSPFPSSSSSSTPSRKRDSPRRLPPIEEVRVIDKPHSLSKR